MMVERRKRKSWRQFRIGRAERAIISVMCGIVLRTIRGIGGEECLKLPMILKKGNGLMMSAGGTVQDWL